MFDDRDEHVGTILGGQYAVLQKIGHGGSGSVYRVEHTQLKKSFAAKILDRDVAVARNAMRRFELEAEAASLLDHDNIVDIVHFGRSDDGTVFLVMELLRGETLGQAIARRALGFDDAVRVAVQVCRALRAAHDAAIIHRDLKPDNIFIAWRPGGKTIVKLLDFGISRMLSSPQARLTQADQVLGTPLYMSPEAARGELDVDARADLYGLGAVMYEMVTGQPPLSAPNYLQVLYRHLTERPRSPKLLRPDLPVGLERLIEQLLEKDPDARPPSAAVVEAALLAAWPTEVDAPLTFAKAVLDDEAPAPSPTPKIDATQTGRVGAQAPLGNLPSYATRFVGRRREISDGRALTRSSRLVTLTGAGGTGKTRLAAEIAQRVAEDFAHGAWMVELAALSDGAQVSDAVARVLALEPRPGVGTLETLLQALADRELLLVLDNCEHLVHACAALAEAIVRSCPQVRVLTTSRERLGLAGETTYRVPPLDGADAVELFIERAREVDPALEVTLPTAAAMARLVGQLDGLPLALELAAARLRSWSVTELEARIGDRFVVLNGGSRTALPRQQTLRALIDWSHDLLDERQRVLLRRLGVFSGGFLEAEVEAVAAVEPLARADVADVLLALVDRSMVVADTRGPTTRYRLLETIRHYAKQQLDKAGETAAFEARHRDAYLALVEALFARYLHTTDDAVWFGRLSAEHDNLREAIAGSLAADRASGTEISHRFAVALRRFWIASGHASEASAAVEAMLAAHPTPDAGRLELLSMGMAFANFRLDYEAGYTYGQAALALASQLGARATEAELRTFLAYLQFNQCQFEPADVAAREALAVAREGDGGFRLIFALNISGMIAARVGDVDRAIALLEECRALTAVSGGRQYHANVLESLGTALALRDGRWERGLPYYLEAAELYARVGDPFGEIAIIERIAQVSALRGAWERAAVLFGAAEAARERPGASSEPVNELDLVPIRGLVRGAMTSTAAAHAWAVGRTMPFRDAVALAVATASGYLNPP